MIIREEEKALEQERLSLLHITQEEEIARAEAEAEEDEV